MMVSAVVAVQSGALAEPGQHSDLRAKLLLKRRLKLTELVARTSVPCLHLVQGFDNGAKLFKAADHRRRFQTANAGGLCEGQGPCAAAGSRYP
jgi:hypothetical protein